LILAWAVFQAGCFTGTGDSSRSDKSYRFPYQWLDEPGFGGDIDQQDFPEPSGIAYHPKRDTLFIVSDEGFVGEIKKDGTPISLFEIPGDLEGVTVDPESDLVYVLVEAVDIILEIDPDSGEVLRQFEIDRSFAGNPNFIQKQTDRFDNGCESIAFVADKNNPEGGTFFVSNQWDPSCIFELDVPLKSGEGKKLSAKISRVLPIELDDPAAMYFDDRTRLLNIVSDADNILYEVALDGRIVNQYAFLGDNQEGLTRDSEGYLYIAQDTGGIIKVKDLR
jgi:uncharacterized protein YjiK